MTDSRQPMRDANIRALVDYFEGGIKEEAAAIGIELEHTLVKDNGDPVSYTEEHGQRWLLERLASGYAHEMRTSHGELIGLVRKGASVTLEPAAQLELSAGPFTDLNEAKEAFGAFEREVAAALDGCGIEVLTPGYHPTRRAVDLELIPKTRYGIMNEYLGAISMFGICMMRGSASTQVSIDYTSVADCLRKLRLASACVPIFSLICDNSPMFEGAVRPHQLVRTEIWEKCDPARCTLVPGVLDADFSLERYAAYILDTPSMVEAHGGSETLSERAIGDVFAERVMTREDIEHVLSVFFTDVRLKTYIEIRPADAMPVECAIAYAALVKGLFYNEGSLDAMDRLFAGVQAQDVVDAKAALMESGYDARIYGSPVSALADELISLADLGLPESERALLAPLAQLVAARQTLAQIALDEVVVA